PLHRHIEIIRRRERLFDEVGTEHGLADAQAFVEQIVIHFLLLSCVNRNHLPQIPYVPSTSEYPFRSQRTPRNAKKNLRMDRIPCRLPFTCNSPLVSSVT